MCIELKEVEEGRNWERSESSCILLVYSHHIDSRVSWGHLHLTYCQHSLYRQTLLLVGSHAASPPFGTVFLHLYALLIVSLVLGLSSRDVCSQDICSRSVVRACDTLPGLSRVINSLLTYLHTCGDWQESQYKPLTTVDQLAIHFSLDGNMIHIDSEEAKRQMAVLAASGLKGQNRYFTTTACLHV